jgi:hypothetical protein
VVEQVAQRVAPFRVVRELAGEEPDEVVEVVAPVLRPLQQVGVGELVEGRGVRRAAGTAGRPRC